MRTTAGLPMAVAVLAGLLSLQTTTVAQNPAQQLIADAVAAMGGRDRVMAVKTLMVEGGGHDFQVDQEFAYDELGSQFLVYQLRDYKRSYDLANGRGRFEQVREAQSTIFNGQRPQRSVQALDGDIAFNVGDNGNATRVFQAAGRRVEYLRHPLTLMRAALAPNATLSNVRTEGTERLVDLELDAILLTVAFDANTKLPSRVVQLVYSETLGDRPNEMRWSDYRAVSGVQLPTLFTWKVGRWTVGQVRVVRQTVDGDVGNLAAPAAVVSAPRPAAPPPPQSAVREIAKGIWEHTGTTHKSFIVECSDHLVLVDAPNVERTLAVMARAKELRPNKPVTTLILGHNHGDHTGGIRTAVALGVNEIVTHRSNLTLLDETFKNPHTLNPDLYSKTPNAKPPKITAIDDQGVLKDAMNTINLYHLLDSSHSRTQLMIYYANARMLTLADVYMPNDPRVMIPASRSAMRHGSGTWRRISSTESFRSTRWRRFTEMSSRSASSWRRRYSSPRSRRRPTEGAIDDRWRTNGQRTPASRERHDDRDGIARHSAVVRADRRAGAAGAALRVRPRSVRLLLGAGGRRGDSVVHHAALAGGRQVGDDAGGAAGVLRGADEAGVGAGAASAAGSDDRGAGGAVRLLLQRPDHQRRRVVVQDAAADRGADPNGDERSHLPVRDVSADHGGRFSARRRR